MRVDRRTWTTAAPPLIMGVLLLAGAMLAMSWLSSADAVSAQGKFDAELLAAADKHQTIKFDLDDPLQGRIFRDGFIPNSPEFNFRYGSTRYVAQRAEDTDTGRVRVYYHRRGESRPMVTFVARPAQKRRTGTVKWFNRQKGYGFITPDAGEDVFVHYSEIRGSGSRNLQTGERVEFTIKDSHKGPQAADVVKIGN